MDTKDIKICLRILDLWMHMKSTIDDFAVSHDLTMQQIMVLYRLYNEDHILMGTLAKHLHCDASNVTGMVDRLQSAGLISRRELPEDRRAKQLAITTQGRGLIDDLIPLLPHSIGLERLDPMQAGDLHDLLGRLSA
jgi:DNA-binding MarR family transcriptional regulator